MLRQCKYKLPIQIMKNIHIQEKYQQIHKNANQFDSYIKLGETDLNTLNILSS